jgi:hypothetical protein
MTEIEFFSKAGEHFAEHRSLLYDVWNEGPDRPKKRMAQSPEQGW